MEIVPIFESYAGGDNNEKSYAVFMNDGKLSSFISSLIFEYIDPFKNEGIFDDAGRFDREYLNGVINKLYNNHRDVSKVIVNKISSKFDIQIDENTMSTIVINAIDVAENIKSDNATTSRAMFVQIIGMMMIKRVKEVMKIAGIHDR